MNMSYNKYAVMANVRKGFDEYGKVSIRRYVNK